MNNKTRFETLYCFKQLAKVYHGPCIYLCPSLKIRTFPLLLVTAPLSKLFLPPPDQYEVLPSCYRGCRSSPRCRHLRWVPSCCPGLRVSPPQPGGNHRADGRDEVQGLSPGNPAHHHQGPQTIRVSAAWSGRLWGDPGPLVPRHGQLYFQPFRAGGRPLCGSRWCPCTEIKILSLETPQVSAPPGAVWGTGPVRSARLSAPASPTTCWRRRPSRPGSPSCRASVSVARRVTLRTVLVLSRPSSLSPSPSWQSSSQSQLWSIARR